MTDYGVLFRELAVPRLVGTPNHQKVREVLIRELEARGFSVERHAFSGRPARALIGAPKQISGVNLIAYRSQAEAWARQSPSLRTVPAEHTLQGVKVWLVAHYDSKGQPISMMARIVGFALVALGAALLLANITLAAVLLGFGLMIVARNRITDSSPGALDNASALITILMAIDQLPSDAPVGVVFPDAEEYGLVGARALAADRAPLFRDAAVINLDGVDDTGRPTVFAHRPGPLGEQVARALHARRWRWLPVVVDGIALASVARECFTILKGGVDTMLVVHTPQDRAARVRLDGAASVAAGLARVLRAG